MKTPEKYFFKYWKMNYEKIIYNIDDLTKAITNKIDDKILNFISQPIDWKYIDFMKYKWFRSRILGDEKFTYGNKHN